MATYRPKSLNEINNYYDKTITTRNVIKVNETAITAVTEKTAPAAELTAEDEALLPPVSTVGDLTEDIQKFIREFSNPVKEEKPLPRTTQIKPAAVRPQAVHTPEKAAEPVVKTEKKPEPPAEKEKVEFVMTAERSELFEEYMRIMSDEDDDTYFSKSKSKKKKKSKKYEEAPAEDIQSEASFADISSDSTADKDLPESFSAPEYESELEIPESPAQTELIPDEEDNYEEPPVKEKKGRVALQLVLIISLLLTLVAALGTTLLNVVFKINTGEAFSDKYYVYTVNKDDAVLNLTKGDLVLAVEETAGENDIVAYYNSDVKAFDFAVKRAEIGEDVIFAENGASNGPINIFNSHVRGKIVKIYPSIGSIVGVISANFALVLAVLMAVALVLILILAFAFGRGKKKDEDALDLYEDEMYESDF